MNTLTWRFIQDEPRAFEEIYTMIAPRLKVTAYRYCRNAENANDVVQDVFAKLAAMDIQTRLKHIGGEDAHLEGWLMVSVKHKAMDLVKIEDNRRKKTPEVRYTLADQTNNLSEEEFARERFLQMCGELQPRQREVMELHMQGYRNEEIAARLDLTYNTVKNNVYEARQRLREIWRRFME